MVGTGKDCRASDQQEPLGREEMAYLDRQQPRDEEEAKHRPTHHALVERANRPGH